MHAPSARAHRAGSGAGALGRAVLRAHREDRGGEGAVAVIVAAAVMREGDGTACQRADGDQNRDRPQSLPHRC